MHFICGFCFPSPSEGPEYEYSGSEEEEDEVTEEEGEPRYNFFTLESNTHVGYLQMAQV